MLVKIKGGGSYNQISWGMILTNKCPFFKVIKSSLLTLILHKISSGCGSWWLWMVDLISWSLLLIWLDQSSGSVRILMGIQIADSWCGSWSIPRWSFWIPTVDSRCGSLWTPVVDPYSWSCWITSKELRKPQRPTALPVTTCVFKRYNDLRSTS